MSDSRFSFLLRFESTGRLLAGVLGFFTVLCILLLMLRGEGGSIAYASDEVYRDLALSSAWRANGMLGLVADDPAPATSGVLWQLLLTAGQSFWNQTVSLPVLLGALMALLVLARSAALAQAPCGTSRTLAPLLLLALTSSLALDTAAGGPHLLATALVTMMLLRHTESASRVAWPLSPLMAWWAALAVLVRVELALVWVALALHAVITGPLREGRGQGIAFPLVRVFTGLIIIVAGLTPAVAWNYFAIGVPWPRFPDAPLSLDAWASAAGAVRSSSLAISFSALGECYVRAFSVPLLRGILPLVLLLAGLYYSVRDARQDRQKLLGTWGFVLLLVPALYAAVYPYVGWGSSNLVFRSLQPAWAVLMALGLARGAADFCPWAAQRAGRELPWLSPGWAVAVLLTWLSLAGLLRNVIAGREEARNAAFAAEERARAAEALGAGPAANSVAASDRIGWLAFTYGGRWIDLSGTLHPVLLSLRDGTEAAPAAEAAYLRSIGLDTMVLWSEAHAPLAKALGCAESVAAPRVCRVR